MATTPNYGFTVYASTDTSVKFLDFRTSIAGTATSSNFYKIDSLLKTVNDTLDTMDLVTATYSSNNNYKLSISKTKLKRFYTFIVKFSATNSSSTQVTFTTNDSSSPASGPVYIGYTTSLIQADPYQFLPGCYYLCHYNSSNFYILGANSGKQITVKMDATNNEEVLVCKKTSGSSSPAIIETSGMPIGSAGGFATLDSSGKVVQTANNATNATNATTAANANKLSNKTLQQITPNYSSSETVMPYTWINGKTIYRQCLELTASNFDSETTAQYYPDYKGDLVEINTYQLNSQTIYFTGATLILPMSCCTSISDSGLNIRPISLARPGGQGYEIGARFDKNGTGWKIVLDIGRFTPGEFSKFVFIVYYIK